MAAKDLIDGQNIKIAKLESQVDTVLGESIPDMIKLISAAEQVSFYETPLQQYRCILFP